MTARLILVAEVGGTTTRAAVFDPLTRDLVHRSTDATPAPMEGEPAAAHHRRVLDALARLGDGCLQGRRPEDVGVAYPGPLDGDGRVLAAPTLHRRADAALFDLPAACREVWPGAEVRCANDLTAAGLHYASTGRQDFAVLTVGSGIGHKVFLAGAPCTGRGRGGEIGHLRLDFADDAPRCDCGGRGHLGALASGRGTVEAVRRLVRARPDAWRGSALAGIDPDLVDGPDVVRAFQAGDALVATAVATAARHLGQALAAIHLDTGVEDLVIVGGFATAMGESYRRLLVAAAAASAWDLGQDWNAMIVLGDRADDAALLGMGLAVTNPAGSPRP